MKGRMNKKDLDCMVKDADSDNDGFINCKGCRTKQEKYFTPRFIVTRVLPAALC